MALYVILNLSILTFRNGALLVGDIFDGAQNERWVIGHRDRCRMM